MKLSRGRPAEALIAVLSIYGTAAQISVNMADVDPLKDCKRREVQHHYLRIVDFTTARNLNESSILTIKDIPGNTTVFQNGAFWADSKRVWFVGGDVNDEGWLARDGHFYQSNYTNVKGGSVFTYNLEADKWLVEPAVQPSEGSSVLDSFCCGSFAYNAPARKAYFYSGTNGAGARKLDPFSTPIYVGRTNEDTTGQGNLLTFDADAFKWRNVSLDTQLTTTGTVGGQFSFLPSTQSAGGGIGVLIGGRRRDGSTDAAMESMRTVLVYDAATDSWYKQATTVEGDGDYPDGRANFCAVAASAPDGSSHNIYVYAGESDNSVPNAYSDIWILTVPSFHWIRADVDSPPRKSHGCTAVGQRYMLTYGGVPSGYGEEGDKDDCDQQNYGLRLFDMSKLAWTSEYDGPPANGNNSYTVPKVVYNAIGGNEQGKATRSTPSGGFETAGLGSIFKKSIPTGITTSGSSEGTGSSNSSQSPKKETNVGAIAGGVLGGLVVLAAVLVGVLVLLKRKRKQREGRPVEAPADEVHQPYVGELPANTRGKWAAHEVDSGEYVAHELPTGHNAQMSEQRHMRNV
ncbi:hypothetical protein N0V90_002745 [Kalmusia sp. IMI 367209]|nr:hypothetical protein N0V90_002745 [Kalmusia sp. IMI 367209]